MAICEVCNNKKSCGKISIMTPDEDGFDIDIDEYDVYIRDLSAKYCPNCGQKIYKGSEYNV